MAIVTTNSQNYSDIAEAIRQKSGSASGLLPAQMANAIKNIQAGYSGEFTSVAIPLQNAGGASTASYTFNGNGSLLYSVALKIVFSYEASGPNGSGSGGTLTLNTAITVGIGRTGDQSGTVSLSGNTVTVAGFSDAYGNFRSVQSISGTVYCIE